MGKKLAIKGHSTRGKEVIELLEMMGGKNKFNYHGESIMYSYYVSGQTILNDRLSIIEDDDFVIFSLEEFFEKYPFKTGDKVIYTKFGDDYPITIQSMKWTGTTIEYTFDGCVTCLAKDLKMWNGEPDTVISGIYLDSYNYADEVELNLGDYEIEVRNGRTYAIKKKPKYPKTYAECCIVLQDACMTHKEVYKGNLIQTFQKLFICRDAYWKIAGEQMGLDKPWKPDWNTKELKYIIYYENDKLWFNDEISRNTILTFPTEEMRDAFYGNFKDLIEQCKELL